MYSRTLRSFALPHRQFLAARQFQTSSRLCARKDAQGKDDLKPEPNEMSKSGSDDQAAAVEDAAFNPKKTSPEDEYNTAGGESAKHGKMNNPLDVSPANHEVSKPRSGTEGGHEGSSAQAGDANSQRARTSGGGSSPKKGGGQYGGGSVS
ncbi:hypothetical protein KC327_g15758 [Hortaea werneckii]|uniref:Uncharacterized protein n=1 Tax=Hortaea werneckii TaxID=91943 RepID=A0A3M7IS28_HORWE|nr:hypothetical protein KC350_g15569 [Hortaea werneckii]KAI6903149.1 hypothetical protein KC348_g15785 [Hortaea werneckii]KAI6955342.1 hypothetical protein KC321_g15815 [Hortaea werneckii]KAI6963686.1 hypothetical protein KC329_g15871 [Hortaea werneckii]KAI7013949.1 hypothetical protein KC362_g15852 [Hortaea werneckii]